MNANDPQAIRTEIERTRGKLSHDVDALADRMSPRHMARRRMDRVRSGMARVKARLTRTAGSS